MKRGILGIVFLLSAIGTSFGQGQPTSEQVVAAIRKQQALDHEENTFQFRIRDEKAIRFIPGKFTGLNREECIAICATEAGRYVSDYALLMYRTAGGLGPAEGGVQPISTASTWLTAIMTELWKSSWKEVPWGKAT